MAGYDSVDVSPLDKPRRTTNRITLGFFIIFMVAFLGTAIYAFVKGDIKKIKVSKNITNNDEGELIKDVLDKIFDKTWMIVFYLVFSIVSTLLSLLIVRGISRFIIRVSIGLECIYLVYYIVIVIMTLVKFNAIAFISQLIVTLFIAWSVYVKVYTVRKVGTQLMSLVVNEAARAIFQFPGTIVLSILITVLIFMVLVLGISVLLYLSTISNSSGFVMVLLHFINTYSTIWFVIALGVFAQMVFSGTFGTWYWSMDKNNVPGDTTLQNLSIVFKFHLGTIAYMSSVWVIIPIIWTMIKGLTSRTYESRHNIFVLIVCWFNIFTKIFDSSISATAIHGKSFTKAADTVCKLYLRFPVRLYAITKAYEWCVYVMVFISAIVVSVVTIGINMPKTESDQLTAVLAVSMCIIIVILPLVLILQSAVTSIFYCILEDHERSIEDGGRRSFMKSQIKELMIQVDQL